MGFGLSQLFPILLGLPVNTDEKEDMPFTPISRNFTIIEEPESNLHPNNQSRLADFFTDIKNNFLTDLIIETHSEYLIRKFQFLVADKQIDSNDIVIYYFQDPLKYPNEKEQVKRIVILEDGSLSDTFGPGFFDEATNLQWELMRWKNSQKN